MWRERVARMKTECLVTMLEMVTAGLKQNGAIAYYTMPDGRLVIQYSGVTNNFDSIDKPVAKTVDMGEYIRESKYIGNVEIFRLVGKEKAVPTEETDRTKPLDNCSIEGWY